MRVVALMVLVACGSDAPELRSLTCEPNPMHAGSPSPHTVDCTVKYDGEVGDVRFEAKADNGAGETWSMGYDYTSSVPGTFHFTLKNATTPPPLGTFNVHVYADHPHGIDGPGDDTIDAPLEVIP